MIFEYTLHIHWCEHSVWGVCPRVQRTSEAFVALCIVRLYVQNVTFVVNHRLTSTLSKKNDCRCTFLLFIPGLDGKMKSGPCYLVISFDWI